MGRGVCVGNSLPGARGFEFRDPIKPFMSRHATSPSRVILFFLADKSDIYVCTIDNNKVS